MKNVCGDRFSGLVQVEDQADGRHDKLLTALSYTTQDGLWTITVPEGFITDYASIPRPLWAVIPPRGRYNRAAIVHDYLYQMAPIDPRTSKPCSWTTADAVIREACENLCVERMLRWTIWMGLRAGGWVAWRRYRSKDTAPTT